MSEQKVAPGLLLAMPHLPDPNFSRSVVLMVEHTPGGSWGLIVNRPTPVRIAEVLDQLEVEWEGLPDAVVWSGGPVEPQSGCMLHQPVSLPQLEQSHQVVDGLVLSMLPEQLRHLASEPPERFRFLLGYAGWGAGQLESELALSSWLIAPADPEIVFGTPPDRMWETAIQSLGIDPSTLVPAAGVH